MEPIDTGNRLTRGAFWASAAFYALIALEFFYMFSPFAIYVYGVYGPGLDWLAMSGPGSSLVGFFMPHIARETTSFFITWHEAIGLFLFVGGLAAFGAGAVQIYLGKIRRRGAITGGIYRTIRHPQYLALMIAGFGMVLVWPRYLVLAGFVTVCFAYYFLARAEEQICLKMWPDYARYRERTGMFLPPALERLFRFLPMPKSRFSRLLAPVLLYLLLLGVCLSAARLLHNRSVQSLYTWPQSNEVYLSVGRFTADEFEQLHQIARSDQRVAARIDSLGMAGYRFIHYVMPLEVYISEVPMYIPGGKTPTHERPSRHDQTHYKIIHTIADFGAREPAGGLAILRRAIHKTPVLEVWIDREQALITRVIESPGADVYHGIPVPVF